MPKILSTYKSDITTNSGHLDWLDVRVISTRHQANPNGNNLASSVCVSTVCVGMIIVCLLFAASLPAFGQDTRATLGGKVTDSTGADIPNAAVVVTADATGVVQKTTTNGTGDWKIIGLIPGHYHFSVSSPGFEVAKAASLDLQVSDQKTIDTALKPGSQAISVTVESTTPLIVTTAAVAGTVLTAPEMEELPTLSNAASMFIALVPGVTVTNGLAGSGVYLWSNSGLSDVASNGTSSATGSDIAAINYIVDGGNDMLDGGGESLALPVDQVGEFRISVNAYDASIGRTSGTSEIFTTKTGGRKFHGDGYELNENDFLNANSYANDSNHKPLTPIHSNQYGGVVDGPVWIPKLYDGRKKGTFFTFGYGGIRITDPTNIGYTSVPDAAERAGNFSESYTVSNGVTYPIIIYDPNTVVPTTPGNFARAEFPDDTIPTGRLDPVAQAILQLVPLPNSAPQLASGNDTNNFFYDGTQTNKLSDELLRVDEAWNNSNHTFISLTRNNWNSTASNLFGNTTYKGVFYGLDGSGLQARLNRNLVIDHTLVINKGMVLDLNYNIMNHYIVNTAPTTAGVDPTLFGWSSTFAGEQQELGIPELSGIGSLGTIGTTLTQYNNDTDQDFKGSVTENYKNHSFEYGAEYLLSQEGAGTLSPPSGTFTFGDNWTDETPVGTNATGSGTSIADFELGLPNGGSINDTATAFWSEHYTAFYFQDNWRVTPKLTLNLGLRWDYERPVTERFNRFASRFDPNYVVSGVTSAAQPNYAALIGGASAGNTGLALLQAERPDASTFVARGGLLYAGVDGTSRYVENPRYKYFQPRLGFAYQIFSKTEIKGGLGRFVQADFNLGAQTGYSQTTSLVATTDNYESAPTVSLENPFPNGIEQPTGNSQGELTNIGSEGSFIDPNIGRIYTDTATASLQQQVGRFLFDTGFTLAETHGLGMAWEINDPSTAAWQAAYGPQFTATGAPVLTNAGSTNVANPFYHVAGIEPSLSQYTSATVSAYSLLRPNPLLGNLTETRGTGLTRYTALENKVERRFHNGFSLLSAFTWGKSITADNFYANQVAGAKIQHTLDPNDTKFHYVLTPVYELPFGRGKAYANHVGRLTDEVIGGWTFSGSYNFQSGTPVGLPTETAFFEGGDPSLGKNKTPLHWFNTSKFEPFPTSSTTAAQLAAYPAWTGVQSLPGAGFTPTPTVPGYANIKNGVYGDFATHTSYNQDYFGDVRNPYVTTFTIGLRKKFAITDSSHFELGMDIFNALNHPQFGSIDVTPGDPYFGAISGGPASKWSQVNNPRAIQLTGKIFF